MTDNIPYAISELFENISNEDIEVGFANGIAPVIAVSQDGRIRYMSSAACGVYRINVQPTSGRFPHVMDIFELGFAQDFLKSMERTISSGRTTLNIERQTLINGAEIPTVTIRKLAETDSNNHVVHVIFPTSYDSVIKNAKSLPIHAQMWRVLDTLKHVLVFAKDSKGKFVYVNNAFASLFEMDRSEILGLTDAQINPDHPEEVRRFIEDDERVMRGQVKQIFATRIRMPPLHELDIACESLTDAKGVSHLLATHKERVLLTPTSPVLVGVSTDISEHQAALKTASQSEEMLRYVMSYSNDAIHIKNAVTHELLAINQKMCRHLGVTMDSVGQDMRVLRKDDASYTDEEKLAESQAVKRREPVVINGWIGEATERWYRVTHTIPVLTEGEPPRIISVTKDNTDSRVSEESFYEIFNTLPHCIFVKDRDFKFIKWNKSFKDWHFRAVGIQDFLGLTDFDLWKSEQAEIHRKTDEKVVESGKSIGPVLESQRFSDGSLRDIQTRKFPLKDHDGNVIGILGVFEDLTQQQRAESNLLIQEMSRSITHPLSSHMIALRKNCDLQIKESGETANLLRLRNGLNYLQMLWRSLQNVASLSREDFETIDVYSVVLEAWNQTNDNRVAEPLPPKDRLRVFGSDIHLKMAVFELLANATRFCRKTAGMFIATRDETRRGRTVVDITVGDDGPGVNPKLRERLFFPGATSDRRNHTGMGLAYAMQVARLHEGEITHELSGRFGPGSHFVLTIPLSQFVLTNE